MALSLSNRHAAPAAAVSRRTCSKPRVVVVRAGLGDAFNFVGQAFMKIFSPPQDNGVTWSGTTNSFEGRIKHHDGKRPFPDNYVAGGQKYSAVADQAAAVAAETAEGRDADVMDYVGGALERVVGHNFTGDETEPPTTTGAAGWKGDIHDRKTDGFHSRRG